MEWVFCLQYCLTNSRGCTKYTGIEEYKVSCIVQGPTLCKSGVSNTLHTGSTEKLWLLLQFRHPLVGWTEARHTAVPCHDHLNTSYHFLSFTTLLTIHTNTWTWASFPLTQKYISHAKINTPCCLLISISIWSRY